MGAPASILVSAGEASGDRLIAALMPRLQRDGASVFGLAGPAASRAGVELVADLRTLSAMGFVEVLGRLPAALRAFARVRQAALATRPAAALLVDFTEFNARLGRSLRSLGIPVLWCGAPQVWAWQSNRMATMGLALDCLAVLFPFERELWRAHGIDAHYVGHPALEVSALPRDRARAELGIECGATCIALLPGSRGHELRRHLPSMLEGHALAKQSRPELAARVLLAPSLDEASIAFAETRARQAGVRTIRLDAGRSLGTWLAAFDGAVCVSGTATLECALAGLPLVIVYRAAKVTFALARRLVRVPYVGLPNIVLGERRYPELVQAAATADGIAAAFLSAYAEPERFHEGATELVRRFERPDRTDAFAERVAALLASLSARPARATRSPLWPA